MRIGIDIDDTTFDKLKAAKENKIELFIEDSYDTCKELSENGIKSILMTTKMNQDIHQGNIVRVKNWKEIYEEILKIESNFYILEKNIKKY